MTEFGFRAPTMLAPTAERSAQVGSLSLHLNERGTGRPLVVLHHSTGPFWSQLCDRLAESFRVIAPDMPGYGQSSRPVTARSPAHLAVYLLQWLDVVELDRVDIVGLGFGGFVAAEMAAMHQGRFATLTLVGAPGIKPRAGFIHDPMTESWTDYMRQSFRDDDAFHAMFGAKPAQPLLDLWDYSREMTARVTWKPWMWSLTLPDHLRAVRTPALVVWGRHDRIVPIDVGEQFVDALVDARLEVVEDAGHAVDLEQPDELARRIEAFTSTTGG
jgi:pimeloyl-ACP methyl ester carboxylesterase